MSHHTPSQAEGERDDGPRAPGRSDEPVEYTTPSQAEGERDEEVVDAEESAGGS
ncbi:hypothetical protein [Streptomyces sp. CC219B]|uniref:hypothetical protein n=1 Tax=Streptomyces sp. CC219B TaxID=3044574 RepID=UPI0024A94693|nr:hypothetical protein [Streptomyces sp. CC219B]